MGRSEMQHLVYGFWKRLEDVCNEQDINKKELAKRMGVSRKCFYPNAHNTLMPSAYFIARFCAETHTSADWLLGITERKGA
jgi:DNA-binding XRE family transcriptional regulator